MASLRKAPKGKRQQTPTGEHGNFMILAYLIAFRLVNVFLIQTFFQPDEYFQSLEPAWQVAFGQHSGAWITWEWREHLRSSMHPYLFAAIYRSTAWVAGALAVSHHTCAEMLLAAPKATQAIIAALMDYYIWRLSTKHSQQYPEVAKATLYLSIFSPWQWFCSTRTLMNSLESSLTAAVLYYWPWDLFVGNTQPSLGHVRHQRWALRKSLCLAAVGSILRAPNIIIWVVTALVCSIHAFLYNRKKGAAILPVLVGEGILCGLSVLGIALLADRQYYGQWTLPPLRFLQFNVVQSLAVFYGKNRPDYYVTEGLPLLMTTALPFAVIGIIKSLAKFKSAPAKQPAAETIATLQTRTSITVIATTITLLSLIPHKEVRFLYPLLPILTLFAAREAALFFHPFPFPAALSKRILLGVLLAANIAFAGYISLVHQRGVIDVTHYLRREYEAHYLFPALPSEAQSLEKGQANGRDKTVMTAAFLMPCHSTPWRSHLVYSGIDAWALTCEPPLDKTVAERTSYLDEADEFYAAPRPWLDLHMEGLATIGDAEAGGQSKTAKAFNAGAKVDKQDAASSTSSDASRRAWPEYLVFFEQLQPLMATYLADTRYTECWRGFNSHFHDDWRRKGDVIVWCLRGSGTSRDGR